MSEPSVFISSTFVDFKEERNAVAEVLREFSIKVNAIGLQPSSSTNSKSKISKGITEADFVILLVGSRYGSILGSFSENNSVTHWEYLLAKAKNKSFLVYFYDKPNFMDDEDADFKKKQYRLFNFRKRLSNPISGHDVYYPTSIEDLKSAVRKSIIPMYSEALNISWKKNNEIRHKLNEIEEKIKNPEEEIKISKLPPPNSMAAIISGFTPMPMGLMASAAASEMPIRKEKDEPKNMSGLMGIYSKDD